MKVVLDTNVLISAFLFKGTAAAVYDYCVMQTEVHISEWIMGEFLEKLSSKFNIEHQIRKELEEVIREKVRITQPHTKMPGICRDQDDNQVLQLAESISADYIVTGDQDLLILDQYQHTQIMTPGMFRDKMMKSSKP